MKLVPFIATLSLLMTSAALAARGDAGEGNGGGNNVRPEPKLVQVPYVEYEWQTKSVPRQVSEQVQYSCSSIEHVPATLSGGCSAISAQKERFDDFSGACKLIPASTRTVTSTCTRTETRTVYENQQVQVAVTKYRSVWQCPKRYPKMVEYTEKGKIIRYCTTQSDRGNVGNR